MTIENFKLDKDQSKVFVWWFDKEGNLKHAMFSSDVLKEY